MRVLITGANGLLGQKLTKLMVEKPDIETIATSRGACRIQPHPENMVFYPMDITDLASVRRVCENTNPDVIINTAAMTQVDDCEENPEACYRHNVQAVDNLLLAAYDNNARFIQLSTDFIFDGENGPYREDDLPNPVNYYGECKLQAENLVKRSDLDWAILRTVLVYGISPGLSRSNIILWVKNNLEQGKTLNIVTDQWRTPTLAEDLAHGCYLAASKFASGIYHISGKDLLTPYDMAMLAADYFSLDKSLIKEANASNFSQKAKRPPKTGFVIEKAIHDLGYEPHSFSQGIDVLARQLSQIS